MIGQHLTNSCGVKSPFRSETEGSRLVQGKNILRKGKNRVLEQTPRCLEDATNHKLVVAWQLLEAVCPVLVTRGGIPRKGLTAQWLQQFVSLHRGKLPFLLSCSSIPARRNSFISPPVVPFVGPVDTTSSCALRGPDGVLSPLRWTSKHLHNYI